MKKKQVHRIGIGLLLTLAVVGLGGCSGGGSDGGAAGGSVSGVTGSTSNPPPAATYTVRGTVSGLLGTGLVLQNNGTDDLVVNPNEGFRFLTRVEDGSTCNVTILSQPTSPAQTCEVINGSRMVAGSDITDVQVRCGIAMHETFDSGALNLGFWTTSGEYDRRIVDGLLQFNLVASGAFAYDFLGFEDSNCGQISAEVAIINTGFTGTGDKAFGSRLRNCGYHTAMEGEAPGLRTGDVGSEIIWSGTEAFFRVYRCLDDECTNAADSVEYLTPGNSKGVLLGTTPPGLPATLLIDWNSALAPGQFTFQLNNDPPQNFDPVAAGAAIAGAVPNKPEKYIGAQISLGNPADKAEMTATVNNIMMDGLRYDGLGSGKYLDGSFWKKTDGRRQIENGRLVLETGQEFVGDSRADNRFNNTTTLTSLDGLIPNGEVVEADITMSPATILVDLGGNPAEVYALLEMEFRPPGVNKKDSTNLFAIRAGLKEDPLGVTAVVIAEGCADYSCSAKYPIANAKQTFTTPVVKGEAHHLQIEHLGDGAFGITLDGNETLSVDLSPITEFASTEFSVVQLRTASRGTDRLGEEAFIQAFVDDVRAGRP